MHGAWAQRLLDIYQTLTKDGELTGGLKDLAPRHVLRQSLALLAQKKNMDLSKGLLGSAQDVCLTIELLLDYDHAEAAFSLLSAQWGKTNIDTYLLELAKAILARQSNNGIQLHCVNQWIDIYEFIHSKLINTDFESVKEQFALIIAENHLAAKNTPQA